MITQAELVLFKLRAKILNGEFAPGTHLMEIPLSQELEVSRTPVRLALGELAKDGLLRYVPKSGFVVRSFKVKEIVDSVLVRGRLEGLACRLVAEQGLDGATLARLQVNLEQTAELAQAGEPTEDSVRVWCELNGDFHDTLVARSDNESLQKLNAHNNAIPLVAANTMAATIENLQLVPGIIASSLTMHRLVLDAIVARQPDRAEMLMQEHVHQGRQSLSQYLATAVGRGATPEFGAIKLVET
jgi:GntR family transcriptional regulator of vanillate catabolism